MSRVALIGENSLGYVNALLDIWNNGDCAVLIDWRIPFSVAIEMMQEADVQKCFVEQRFFERLTKKSVSNITMVPYEKISAAAEIIPNCIYDKFHSDYSNNEAVVIYSSGTTGKSKGVILSHFAINTNADAIIDYMKPSSEDCIYMVKTISHASSLVGELLVALKTRTRLLIAPIIVPPRYTFANIEKYRVSIMCINPTLLQMYLSECDQKKNKYDLSSLKELYVHGAKANIRVCELAKELFQNCAVYYEYGLTEAGPRVTTQKLSSKTLDSVGAPIKDVQVKIITQNGDAASNNEVGAIHVKTPSCYLGYVFGQQKFESFKQGWLNTGDIGFFDLNNELHILNRADDVMIINAHKVYPSEVERQIVANTAIEECVVVQIEHNGDALIGCLYVGAEDAPKAIRAALNKKLMIYEIPKIFLRCEELPRTKTGKVSRIEAKTILQKYLAQEKHV